MLVWKSSCPPHSNANQKVNSTPRSTKRHQNSTKNPLTIASLVFWLYAPMAYRSDSNDCPNLIKEPPSELRDQNRGLGSDWTSCWCKRVFRYCIFSSSVVANSRSAFSQLDSPELMLPLTKARSLSPALVMHTVPNWVCTFSFMTMHVAMYRFIGECLHLRWWLCIWLHTRSLLNFRIFIVVVYCAVHYWFLHYH